MSGKSETVSIQISSDEETLTAGNSSVRRKTKTIVQTHVLTDAQQKPKKNSLFHYFPGSTATKRPKLEVSSSQLISESNTDIVDVQVVEESQDSNVSNSENVAAFTPYYLKNFWSIIDSILGGSTDQVTLAKCAFTEADREIVEKLRLLSADCQKMFIRLFGRQRKWIQRSKIDYDKDFSSANIADDLLVRLVQAGLLYDGSKLVDVEHALDLLTADQAKKFATNFGLFPSTKAKTFGSKTALIAHVVGIRSSISSELWSKKEKRFVGKCLEMIGKCYSVPKETKKLFLRIFLLFSRIGDLSRQDNTSNQAKSGTASLQSQLFTMLEVERGKVKFPQVYADFSKAEGALDLIYRSPEELDLALWFYVKSEKLFAKIEPKKPLPFELADKICQRYRQAIKDQEALATKIPKFLRSMALPSIAKRALFVCSDVYERGKKYKEAVSVLRMILDSNPSFAISLRRKVWPRLILDQSKHLNDPSSALKSALKALNEDDTLTLATRWEIEERVENELCKRVGGELSNFTRKIKLEEEMPCTIKATVMSYQFDKVKTKFVRANSDGGVEICSVEETASEHYLKFDFGDGESYSEALHAEGSSLLTLLGLIFYDIIFSDVPNVPVFLSKFQSSPLDMYTGREFYERRRDAIEQRLTAIRNDDDQMSLISDLISNVWREHENEQAHPISWSVFSDKDQALRLVRALGPNRLRFLMATFISDLHFFHSGFPDLTLWDEPTRSVRFVEVKGPGDTLSAKQRIWLDLLRKNGIKAEVCRVEGVNSRKL